MRVLLVDGYNVIRSTNLYKYLDGDDYTGRDAGLNAAREALISDVAAFSKGFYETTIVFDGGRNALSTGNQETFGGVTVRFSRSGQTADSVIEKLVHDKRETADEIVVVTSDAALQWTVLGTNVTRMSSAEFEQEIRGENSSWQTESRMRAGANKTTLAERLDPEIAAKLAAMVKDG